MLREVVSEEGREESEFEEDAQGVDHEEVLLDDVAEDDGVEEY